MAQRVPLPLKILQQQVCTECDQYLTVLPIVINSDGDVICGRHKVNGVSTLLNKVMENYSFQCINHYEGCQQLLDTSTSVRHEQECQIQESKCPFCILTGNWSRLLQHISRNHPSSIIKDDAIQFTAQKLFSQTYVYCIEDCIYNVRIEIKARKLIFSISNAIQKEFITEKIMVNFSLGGLNKSEVIILCGDTGEFVTKNLDDPEIEAKSYCEININQVQLMQNEVDLMTKLTRLYKRQLDFSNQKDEIIKCLFSMKNFTQFRCLECYVEITDIIFVCHNGHSLCEDCMYNEFEDDQFCSSCGNNICSFKMVHLDEIKINCVWAGCNSEISLRKYIEHKKKCAKRPYICPDEDCGETLFSCEELQKHWHYKKLVFYRCSFLLELSIKKFFLIHHSTELYSVNIDIVDSIDKNTKVDSNGNLKMEIESVNVIEEKEIKIRLELFPRNGGPVVSKQKRMKKYMKIKFLLTTEFFGYKLYFCDE